MVCSESMKWVLNSPAIKRGFSITAGSYRQPSIETPFPALKSVMNQTVFVCPPTTTVFMAPGLLKGSIIESGGSFCHVA